MEDKTLKSKAIDIHGKKYVEVKERVNYFNKTYPNGAIHTRLVSSTGIFIVKAIVIPDMENPKRLFTGYSQASFNDKGDANKTAPLEVAETSSVGRALAFMGIGVIDSVASADEMRKVSTYHSGVSEAHRGTTAPQGGDLEPATHEQMKFLKTLIMRNFGISTDDGLPPLEKELGFKINELDKKGASDLIGRIKDDMDWVNNISQRLGGSLD